MRVYLFFIYLVENRTGTRLEIFLWHWLQYRPVTYKGLIFDCLADSCGRYLDLHVLSPAEFLETVQEFRQSDPISP